MPKIAGIEIKPWMYWVGGVSALLLVVLFIRQGGGSQAVATPDPQPMPGGGGGGGGYIPVAPGEVREEMDEYTQQLQELALKERQGDLAHRDAMRTLEREQAGILAGLFTETERSRAGLERDYYEGERKARQILNEQIGDLPVKCPPGMHPVNMPGVGVTCRQLGNPDGSRGFNPIRQIGQVFSGFLTGAAAAAPGIGSGAANYAAVNAGILPGQQPARNSQVGYWERIGTRSGSFTPGINPSASGQVTFGAPRVYQRQ
jgi:hypothetical protein